MLTDALALIRFPIVLIAFLATLTFSWLFVGTYPWDIACLVGVDWFLINLLNRVTDVEEDAVNQVHATSRVSAWRKRLSALLVLVWLVSWVWFFARRFGPAALIARALVQLVGLAYSIRMVPTPRWKPYFPGGMARIKEIYFAKNFGSAGLFITTCIGYPLLLQRLPFQPSLVLSLTLFFLLFEVTYEVLYDLRDAAGDRAVAIPTFVVVHGERFAVRLVYALLGASALVLVLAFFLRAIGVRELLMLAAPLAQALFARHVLPSISARQCVNITHMGSLLLALYLVGTQVWLRMGFPANMFLP